MFRDRAWWFRAQNKKGFDFYDTKNWRIVVGDCCHCFCVTALLLRALARRILADVLVGCIALSGK